MSGKNRVWMASIVAIVVVVLSVGGALAAQDSRPVLTVGSAQQAATPQPCSDPQPAIDAVAAYFGVPVDEIQALYDSGAGLGVIAEAYTLADVIGMTPAEIVAAKMDDEVSWGEFLKDAGVDPAQVKVDLGEIVSGGGQGLGVQQTAATVAADTLGDQLQDQDRTHQQDQDQTHQQDQDQTHQQDQDQSASAGSGSGPDAPAGSASDTAARPEPGLQWAAGADETADSDSVPGADPQWWF